LSNPGSKQVLLTAIASKMEAEENNFHAAATGPTQTWTLPALQ